MPGIVVVGGGQAGASLTAKLRAQGHDGPVTLLCAEPTPPYQRPPLTKKYMTGELSSERLLLRPRAFYSDQDIDLRLNARAISIDRKEKRLHLDGEVLTYDQLALTTGARPRRLPGAIGGDLSGVHVIREIADADALRPELHAGRNLLVIGGGYIGLEAAAVAASLGLRVTLIEMAPRILNRVAAPETADWFRALHLSHGVRILESCGLEHLQGAGGRVRAARLTGGQEIAVDTVIVGIGITPDTELAEAAGLELDNGIATDAQGRTSDDSIWAAGDCASFPWRGRRVRLESVQNAIDQAELVAQNILGAGMTYDPVPWFWSDQYDVKLQIAGLNSGYDRVVPRLGPGSSASFWYFRDDAFLAVDAMNDPRAYMVGKRLLESGRNPNPATLADPGSNLKALLA
jgi:3-phenylpropionate/trans-cinnamate dioxygenase ferredoxin reductase component